MKKSAELTVKTHAKVYLYNKGEELNGEFSIYRQTNATINIIKNSDSIGYNSTSSMYNWNRGIKATINIDFSKYKTLCFVVDTVN